MSDMEKTLREALIIKYEGEIAEAKANVKSFLLIILFPLLL